VTLRDELNRRLRRATFSVWFSTVPAFVSMVPGLPGAIRAIALAVGGSLMAFALYATFIGGRCPRCGAGILSALKTFGIQRTLPSWLKSCPSCSLSLQSERPDLQRA
jgi:hypothetical protein